MAPLTVLANELLGFFGVQSWIDMAATNDYSRLLTYKGLTGAIGPVLPLLLVLEIVRALTEKNFKVRDYKLIFFTYLTNRVLGSFLSIGALAFSIGLFEPYAIVQSRITWYWLIYGYVVWEFGHFIYHYLAHKVRLFWCLHSTHHAPESMNLFVSHAHFFLEAPYADELGLTPHLAGVERMLREGNGAQQQVKAHLEGESLEQVFAGTVARAHAISLPEKAPAQEGQA